MKNLSLFRFGSFVGMLLAFCFLNCPAKANETNANNAQLSITIPKSVFEPPFRDPFFPNSVRMTPPPTSVGTDTNTLPVKVDFYKDITLKGISGSQNKRLALINNKTMAVGESDMLKTPQGSRRIELLEIKDKSIVIKIEGAAEPKEIYLRQY